MEQEQIKFREGTSILKSKRSPTLDTVRMVEVMIEKNNGEFNKRELWEKLPKKILWGTYVYIIDYLEDINKILISADYKLCYIWSPKLPSKYLAKYLQKNAKKKTK